MEVTLLEMLEARERRVERQRRLLAEYETTLVCFTMNIAGPIKNSPQIRRGFALGRRLLEEQFRVAGIRVLHSEKICENTGNEAVFVLDKDPLAVKALSVEIEDHTTGGRLFDMDVLCPDGRKVDRQELGLPGRRWPPRARFTPSPVSPGWSRAKKTARLALAPEWGWTLA